MNLYLINHRTKCAFFNNDDDLSFITLIIGHDIDFFSEAFLSSHGLQSYRTVV